MSCAAERRPRPCVTPFHSVPRKWQKSRYYPLLRPARGGRAEAGSGVPALTRGQALRPASRAPPRGAPCPARALSLLFICGGNGSTTCRTSFINKCWGLTAGSAVAQEAVGTLSCLFRLRPGVLCLLECPGGLHPSSWWRDVCSALIRPPLAASAQSLRFFELKLSPLGQKETVAGSAAQGQRARDTALTRKRPVSGQRLPDSHSPLLHGTPSLPGGF